MSNFSMPVQTKTGSQIRSAKREGIVKAFTRMEAQALIAGSTDPMLIESFMAHPNGHISRYATHKLDAVLNPRPVETFPMFCEEPVKVEMNRFYVKSWTPEMAREVLEIMIERNMTTETAAQAIGCSVRRIRDWQKKLAK